MKSNRKKKLEVIVEKNDDMLWGRVENKGNFLPTPYGQTITEVIENLKELIADYKKNEGKKDRFWRKVDLRNTHFKILYDSNG